jgi:hypothetical protein
MFSAHIQRMFRSALLPFSDQFRSVRLKSEPDWQYHMTFNGFDGSAHMFLSDG